ncbi:unnamed protein product [Dovyalis caffra]|uniref:X8 domain-containing protein n=1 Tax=Dovyalis caffra TaxID=77055 RepID=A0AAV1S5E2_9ROSI|nr:unnamed protein product [Dovyalis caffra]
MGGTKSKISLEDYLQFFLSHKQFGLSANFLNQIILMHGFKKLHGVPKKVLSDAVDTIDLENLSRSTLKDKNEISSGAFMNVEDIVADMNELDWQECCVTSIHTLNAKSEPQAVAGGTRKRKRGSSSAGAAIDAVSTTALKICLGRGGMPLLEDGVNKISLPPFIFLEKGTLKSSSKSYKAPMKVGKNWGIPCWSFLSQLKEKKKKKTVRGLRREEEEEDGQGFKPMGGRVIYSLMFFLLGLFLSSGLSVTKRLANDNSKQADHGTKQAVVHMNSISRSQKDITTPITTVPTIIPTNPTTSTPIINPNSDPDSISPATMTPMVTPASTSSPVSSGASWCIASQSASPIALQVALDYACGFGGADCSAILSSGSCYNPNTVHDHASYAFNSYYQKNPVPSSCNFGGNAVTTSTNPSTGTCQFPSTSTSSSVLNTTNSNGATVYGAVPSNPTPSEAAKINETPHFMSVTFLIMLLAKLTSSLGYRG